MLTYWAVSLFNVGSRDMVIMGLFNIATVTMYTKIEVSSEAIEGNWLWLWLFVMMVLAVGDSKYLLLPLIDIWIPRCLGSQPVCIFPINLTLKEILG